MNDAFLYYRSFYEATKQFPAEDRLAAHEAIMEYALYGTEPEVTGAAYAIFLMAKPQIDANAKRRNAGRAGGEAKRDNAEAKRSKGKAKSSKKEANESNPEANSSSATNDVVANPSNATNIDVANSSNATQNDVAQLDKYKEKEKENYKEKLKDKLKEKNTKEKESDALAERSFSEPVKEALSDWLQYKREKGQTYKPTGLKQLFDGIETEIKNRGEPAVIEGIRNSMQNNWQGIFYPRPQPQKVEPFDANAYLLERMRTG